MNKYGLTAKVAFVSGLCVLVLLIIGGTIIAKMQMNMTDRLISKQEKQIDSSLASQQSNLTKQLEASIMASTKILAGVCAPLLYNFDSSGVSSALQSQLITSEIIAIQVKDTSNQPTNGVWRDAEIETGASVPEIFLVGQANKNHQEVMEYDGNKIGTVTVYYSTDNLKAEIASQKSKATAELDQLRQETNSESNSLLLVETVILLLVICFMIASIIGGLRFMVINPIAAIADQLEEGAIQTKLFADDFSQMNHQLADGATKQAAGVEETSASLAEISSMTSSNSQLSTDTDQQMKTASKHISKALATLDRLNATMLEISENSKKTQGVVKSIDEIAFQTNLLALNAAVEAARAGEAGAGFAVVADEVRNLAMRAAEAAKSTAVLLDSEVEKVDLGSSVVNETNEAFGGIADIVTNTAEATNQISVASVEQETGIQQISSAFAAMDQIAGQTASIAEKSEVMASELLDQSNKMDILVNTLASIIYGQKS